MNEELFIIIIIIFIIARCYAVAKVYKVLHVYVIQSVPPSRFHVHMFTIGSS